MNTDTETFPIDWDAWQKQWQVWSATHSLPQSSFKFPGKNFLADDVLGRFVVNGRDVELSEVTFPDFTKRYSGERIRYVGITWGNPDGTLDSGGVVESFAELEQVLGL